MPGRIVKNKLIMMLLGEGTNSDSTDENRLIVAFTSLCALPLCSVYLFIYWLIGFDIGVAIMALMICSLMMVFYALRWRVPLFVTVNMLNLVITCLVTCLSFFSGGISSSTLHWLFAPIVMGYWASGPALGLFWGIAGLLLICGLFGMERSGIVTNSLMPPHVDSLVDFSSLFGFLIFFLLIAWILYRQRESAIVARDELLSSRQKMIQTLAHDLKNPVAGIVSRIYLMERRQSSGTNVDSGTVIQAIKKDASSVLESIDRMILLNRSKAVHRAPEIVSCDLRSVVDEAADLHRQWMEAKGIRFDDSGIVATRVLGDRELLVRLFENIISNAIKYSNPQAKIECRVRELNEDNKKFVVVEVADAGVGMDPREAEFFFKLEYRPNRPTAGESSSGVGTSLINEIILAHGGKIWLKSEGRDMGTTVFVQLSRPRE